MTLTWTSLHHSDVDGRAMHDLLRLRHQVFVVEQECPDYVDIDGLDVTGETHHVLGLAPEPDGRVVATARVLAPGTAGPRARIGRVVIDPDHRGGGSGHALMREALAVCTREWPDAEVLLSAQAHLADYYGRHGFAPVGETYLEDDIPHVDMVRPAGAGAGPA
ncbi:GNAT family N-acetyltransferase [Nocardioides sp. AE5]|uniref:GNAT family N-acetyltransferase n=1 Tax=Nocardioides sp. AE5 TaxID=2962573 RepID=UPI0028817AA4|nr:GNAT family N-acetyltransferase [Nocardioides sp. AE5]MDT0200659.1 GNAT family N-acetyltransferase [Nocardioides sp. AE5]